MAARLDAWMVKKTESRAWSTPVRLSLVEELKERGPGIVGGPARRALGC